MLQNYFNVLKYFLLQYIIPETKKSLLLVSKDLRVLYLILGCWANKQTSWDSGIWYSFLLTGLAS